MTTVVDTDTQINQTQLVHPNNLTFVIHVCIFLCLDFTPFSNLDFISRSRKFQNIAR